MKKRKFISIILLLIIFFNIISVKNTSQALTTGELREKMEYVHYQADFIDRSNSKWYFIENYDKYSGASCHGYANAISLALFGSNQNRNFNDWVFTENVDELCVGDIIRYRNDYNGGSTNHTMVVINIIGDTVYITDANHDGYDGIRWGDAYSKSQLASMISGSLCWTDWGAWNKGYFRHYVYSNVKSLDEDTEPPLIHQAYVDPTSMDGTKYTVYAKVTDNEGISKIPVMTKALNSDAHYVENRATKSGDYYNVTVKASDHSNDKGLYNSHVYAYDNTGNGVVKNLDNIPMNSKIVTDLGNFTAKIVLKNNTNYAITAEGTNSNANVALEKKSNNDDGQLWQFNKNSDGKSYEIVNVASGKLLDIYNGKDENGTNVEIYPQNGNIAQAFYIMEYNGGYRIVAKCSSNLKAIDLTGGNVSAGQNIELYDACADANPSQTWTFEKDTEPPVIHEAFVDPTSMDGTKYNVYAKITDNGGISKIPVMTSAINSDTLYKESRATKSGDYYNVTVKASDHNNDKGIYNSHVYAYDNSGNGVVNYLDNIPMGSKIVTNLGDFTAKIVLKSDTNYAIATEGKNANANVSLAKKSGSDNSQVWQFKKKSDGKSYEIINVASGKLLTISNAKDEDGSNVEIDSQNGNNEQAFYIMEYNGGYRIVAKCSSNLKAIDLKSGNVSVGQNIDLYNVCTETNSAQTWIFEEWTKKPNISGTITSYGNENNEVKIELIKKGENTVVASQSLKGNSIKYNFDNIPVGNYILRITKNSHVEREYELSVNDLDITQNVKIYLKGDVNGDGKINIKDWNMLYAYINETMILSSEALQRSDVNEDEKINVKDLNRLYEHVTEVNPL